MNLKEWAEREGVHHVTAPSTKTIAVYARVSSADQRSDLDRQVARVTAWATEKGLAVDRVVTKIGSALNGRLPVVDPAEVDDDLVRDITKILTSLCTRLYGRRAAANGARRAVQAATRDGPA